MTDYQKGKIYRIVCNITGLTYYGSTCEPTLARRLAGHVRKYKNWKSSQKGGNVSSYQVLENENYSIVLVELAPSTDKMELLKKERFHIENNECVNKNIPSRSVLEWRLLHLDEKKTYNDNYRLENIEQITEQQSEYYHKNQSLILKKKSEYYQKNKEKLALSNAASHLKNRVQRRKKQAEYYLKMKALKAAQQAAVLNNELV